MMPKLVGWVILLLLLLGGGGLSFVSLLFVFTVVGFWGGLFVCCCSFRDGMGGGEAGGLRNRFPLFFLPFWQYPPSIGFAITECLVAQVLARLTSVSRAASNKHQRPTSPFHLAAMQQQLAARSVHGMVSKHGA